MSIEQISTRTVYENRWMRVREDEIRRADGSTGIYGVVEKPDFALIVPVDEHGELWLVEQHRYAVGGRFWEFPQGSWEGSADVDAQELARGELLEETGLLATSMRHVGHLYEAYGFSTQGFDVWLATELQAHEPRREAEEQDMRAQRFTRAAVEQMIRDGALKDGPSVAAYGMLLIEGWAAPSAP